MPVAALDSSGTKIKLFYSDTGPLDSKDYTTVVIYHGSAFTAQTFRKISPFVPSSNIRLVLVTRRDYDSHDAIDSPGSTPHTDDELEDIKAGRDIFLQRLALEVANFLIWFAETHKIPAISDDRKSGGISVMGWSIGTLSPMALLGHPHIILKESQQKLASYLRQVIFYNPAEVVFGYFFGTEGGIYPAEFKDFPRWASYYYVHPDLSSPAGGGATTVDSSRRPSLENMTDEDLAVNFDLVAAMKSDAPICFHMLPAIEKQTQAALFDEKLAQEFLPGVQIVWFSCPQAMWIIERAKVLIEREIEKHVTEKRQVRLIKFIEIPGANHFVHWDEPEKFWAATLDAVHK